MGNERECLGRRGSPNGVPEGYCSAFFLEAGCDDSHAVIARTRCNLGEVFRPTQLIFHSKSLYKGGPISLSSGTTGLVVPEQASIGLMGTGLVAIGLLVRRKVKSQAGGRS